MKAIFNKVIIKPITEKNLDKHGFDLGNQEGNNYKKGTVISVGEVVENIVANDVAWYDKNRCTEIKINGEMYDIMENSNIFVVE